MSVIDINVYRALFCDHVWP